LTTVCRIEIPMHFFGDFFVSVENGQKSKVIGNFLES
jgi:hypothetical protein